MTTDVKEEGSWFSEMCSCLRRIWQVHFLKGAKLVCSDRGEDMLPELFKERMQRMLREEYIPFLKSFEEQRCQALRLNSLKKGADGRSAAGKYGIEQGSVSADFAHLTKVPWAADGYYYQTEDQPGKHPFHEAGVYYIQEPSAMAPVELLDVRQGERVLDLCAAPGGKSTQIAAKLHGQGILVCNEIHPSRAKILSENIERMGICNAIVTNETPERLAGFFPGYFDKILVDAPCSGEGMFRKNEEACREWSPENVSLCSERQKGILDCAASMLRPGGKLVYSTCTFAPEEDEGSISGFLGRHEEFFILPIEKKRLGLAGCDGAAEYLGCGLVSGAGYIGEETSGEAGNAEGEMSARAKNMEDDMAGKAGHIGNEMSDRERHRGENMTDEAAGMAVPVAGLELTLRIWPQRVRGEGHYAALLQKAGGMPAGEMPAEHMAGENQSAEFVSCNAISAGSVQAVAHSAKNMPQESGSGKRRKPENRKGGKAEKAEKAEKELEAFFLFCSENIRLPESERTENRKDIFSGIGQAVGLGTEVRSVRFGDHIYLTPAGIPSLNGVKVLRPGLHLGELKKNRFEPSHAMALALAPECAVHVWEMDAHDALTIDYLKGQTFPAEGEKGWYLICVNGFSIGWGKLAGGIMKNHYPIGLRRKDSQVY